MKTGFIIALTLFLSACASGPRVIDAEVRTQAAHSPGADILDAMRYRFDQTEGTVGSLSASRVIALAAAALDRVGAVEDTRNPAVGVQVTAQVGNYWYDPLHDVSNPQVSLGLSNYGYGLGVGFGWPMWNTPTPIYTAEVSLVMRDLSSGQIVYDTHASREGSWQDVELVLPALFAAALQGFPAPAQVRRQIQVPIQPLPADGQP